MNAAQVLKKMAAGNPELKPVAGNSGNATAAPTSQITAAPVAGNSGNASSVPTSQVTTATAPEAGKRGMADKGTLALTKAAGFHAGVVKAAAEFDEDQTQEDLDDSAEALGEALVEEGIDPEVFQALAVLDAHGISLDLSDEAATKVAAAFDKIAAVNRGHVLGALTGSPSAAIAAGRAEDGKKLKAGAKGYLRDVGHGLVGGVGGAGVGAGIGALAAKAMKKDPKAGALIGGNLGYTAGAIGGYVHGGMKTHRETKKSKA